MEKVVNVALNKAQEEYVKDFLKGIEYDVFSTGDIFPKGDKFGMAFTKLTYTFTNKENADKLRDEIDSGF